MARKVNRKVRPASPARAAKLREHRFLYAAVRLARAKARGDKALVAKLEGRLNQYRRGASTVVHSVASKARGKMTKRQYRKALAVWFRGK